MLFRMDRVSLVGVMETTGGQSYIPSVTFLLQSFSRPRPAVAPGAGGPTEAHGRPQRSTVWGHPSTTMAGSAAATVFHMFLPPRFAHPQFCFATFCIGQHHEGPRILSAPLHRGLAQCGRLREADRLLHGAGIMRFLAALTGTHTFVTSHLLPPWLQGFQTGTLSYAPRLR